MRAVKRVIMAAILLLSAVGTYAQQSEAQEYIITSERGNPKARSTSTDTLRWRHNLRIGICTPSLISARFLEGPDREHITTYTPPTASDNLANTRYYDTATYYLPGVTAEYSQYLLPWLSIGGKLSFGMTWSSKRHIYTDELLYRNNNYCIGLIVDIRFDWLRRDIVQMYSSVGLGLATRIAFHNGKLSPMYDMTFVGISIGRDIYGFAEFGGGVSGLLRAGIGYRF